MRGDRPGPAGSRILLARATPHARGSTFGSLVSRLERPGYPACAGIDPDGPLAGRCGPRLPRMRGDRPPGSFAGPERFMATPHARGSTVLASFFHWLHAGYPACAGIDLSLSRLCSSADWLPRMRGDRPQPDQCLRQSLLATPHARGSTSHRIQMEPRFLGYPACAGIDLSVYPIPIAAKRLPRMRGDRPLVFGYTGAIGWATPHARGSTIIRVALARPPPGYPACAGIDRILSS